MPDPMLDEQDLEQIDSALREIDEIEENILRAEEAGISVDTQKRRLEESKGKLRSIKQAFFPNAGV